MKAYITPNHLFDTSTPRTSHQSHLLNEYKLKNSTQHTIAIVTPLYHLRQRFANKNDEDVRTPNSSYSSLYLFFLIFSHFFFHQQYPPPIHSASHIPPSLTKLYSYTPIPNDMYQSHKTRRRTHSDDFTYTRNWDSTPVVNTSPSNLPVPPLYAQNLPSPSFPIWEMAVGGGRNGLVFPILGPSYVLKKHFTGIEWVMGLTDVIEMVWWMLIWICECMIKWCCCCCCCCCWNFSVKSFSWAKSFLFGLVVKPLH